MKNTLFWVTLSVLFFAGCANEITYEKVDGYNLVYQSRGVTLGYTSSPILTVDGFAFKDLNRNGALDLYEDWRLTPEERAKDLASKLPVERICGLMLYSRSVDVEDRKSTRLNSSHAT